MKFESALIALVCANVIALLPSREAPPAHAGGSQVDFCPAEPAPFGVVEAPGANIDGSPECVTCENGFCRRVPDLAPIAKTPPAHAGGSNVGRERSIVTKRSCAPQVHKRGFFARLRARRR